MDWIVTTARTVEEAEIRALDLLGVDRADAEVQVIEEGKTGLFGRTKSEARVRARIKPKAPATKDDRRQGRGDGRNRNRSRSRSRSKGGGEGGGNRGGGNRGGGNRGGGNRGGGNGRRDTGAQQKSQKKPAGAGGGSKPQQSKDRPAAANAAASDGGPSRRRRRRGGGGGDRARQGAAEDRVEMPVAEQRSTLESFVADVAKAFDDDAEITLVEEGTTLLAQVEGDDLGRLIGTKAATLQAVEELARTAMHRAAAGRRYHRIQVDVDGYRARRRAALTRFATEVAEAVADSGVSKAMEPMSAADRKLVHDAVSAVSGVETVSEGRDPRRYIVILPAAVDEEE